MKIIWRKKEFLEFITFRRWAFMRRRVNEMPAYLYPVGFGLSVVRPIHQGFWIEDQTGNIFIGFLSGMDNFHYVSPLTGDMRSEPHWPEPILRPLKFEEGYNLLRQKGLSFKDVV